MSANRKSACLSDLRARILALDLAPGSDLDEVGLSAEYGMSRTPLREVLQRLSGEGYLQISEHRGAKVSSMDLPTMRIFFQTAPLVYATMSRLAAENRTEPQVAALKEIQAAFAAATAAGNAAQAALCNHAFHAKIGEMSANLYLKPSLDRMLIDHTRLSQTFYRPASAAEYVLVRKASEQHDALIAAIDAREPALAVELTLKHWDLSRDRLERFVQPDPLPLDISQPKDQTHAV